jgi:hypothetical protein
MRRYGLQALGLLVALLIVGVLAVVGLRGNTGRAPVAATASASAARSASPTVDPNVEAVKAVVRAYVAAEFESGKTGDPKPLHAFTAPGSQADGEAGSTATFSRTEHRNFAADRIAFIEEGWHVTVAGSDADVTFSYTAAGHEVTWPDLQRSGPDKSVGPLTRSVHLELTAGRWLLSEGPN